MFSNILYQAAHRENRRLKRYVKIMARAICSRPGVVIT